MLTYSDYFENKEITGSYFAGANTPAGFVGEYENLLSEETYEKIYMIKGGSGTGKSTLIRKAGELGKLKGGEITYLLCSSDPDSLDGVIIEKGKRRIAVIDATAPHTRDPEYPGACGEIFNCGDFWDASVLKDNKTEIVKLCKQKKDAYERAYRYLSAAGCVAKMQERIGEYCLEREKMISAVRRMCEKLGKSGGEGNILCRRTCAVSMKGAVRLRTFDAAKTVIGIEDCTYIAPLFYLCLANTLARKGHEVLASFSPINGICEIYVADIDMSFVPHQKGRSFEKTVNLHRFANKERMGETKQKRIFASKCHTAMLEGALESLGEAGIYHYRIEDIYKEAMDFKALEKGAESLYRQIEKSLD